MPSVVGAQDESPARRPGIHGEVMYTGDVFVAPSGALSSDAVYLDNLDLIATIDVERLLGARRTLFQAHIQSNRGSAFSGRLGDFQGASNIETDAGWRLYELWIEHNAVPGRLSLLGGVYDVNSEFDVIPVAGDFINSSFGFGADYASAGAAGPSTFPSTSWAFRARGRPFPFSYVAVSVSDGDPVGGSRSRLALGGGEGALVSFEAGYRRAAPGENDDPAELAGRDRTGRRRIGRGRASERLRTKIAVGGWAYTRAFETLDETEETTSWGAYFLAQRLLGDWGNGRGIAAFTRLGAANDAVNRIGSYLGGGLVVTGPLGTRAGDEIGLGVGHARNGTPFLRSRELEGLGVNRAETVIESFYVVELSDGVRIQPNIQILVHPDMDPDRPSALALGMRGTLAFALP